MNEPAWYQRVGRSGRRLSLDQRHYERGLDYFAQNHIDLAIADLDMAIELAPRAAEYYAARGLMLLSYNAPNEAEEDFARSLALDPAQWLAHYGRGIHAFQAASYEAAIAYFSRAQHVAPERPEIYFYRAVAFFQNDNPREASADMRYALTLFAAKDSRRAMAEKWLSIFTST